MDGRFAENPSYVEYERLLMALHRLIAEGKGDTDEADAVREQMEWPERNLSRDEMDRLNGLSADLYMLQGNEIFESLPQEERTRETLGIALKEAKDRRDWQKVLDLLRKGPVFLTSDQIAFIRTQAYKELGHLETALAFIEYAASLEPENALYDWKATEFLLDLGRYREARARTDEQLKNKELAPELLIQSASSMVAAAKHASREEASALYNQAIKLLRHVLPEALLVSGESASIVAFGYTLLGHCYEIRGQFDDALDAYNDALTVDPEYQLALVARGLLLLATRAPGSSSNRDRTRRENTPVISPYINSAHEALTRRVHEAPQQDVLDSAVAA
jgi:tetratricopeptide (TPR) repeat protein